MNKNKEWDALKRFKEENKRLKRENQQLRKQLDKLENYSNLRGLARQQYEENVKSTKSLAEKWACWQCGRGILRIIIVPQRDGEYYYRQCDHCTKRTKKQKYSKEVEGLK